MRDGEPTVVSTTPSGTEICYALGVEPAAVSHQCDFPPGALNRPVLTRSLDGGPDDDPYAVDVALLEEVDPDVVVTQTVCGTCAVDEALLERELGGAADHRTVPLNARDLEDVYDCIHQVGEAVGRTARAETVVEQLRDCVAQVNAMTAEAESTPRVLVLEWLDPLRAAGNWVPDLVATANGTMPIGQARERSTELTWEQVREVDPDVLVVAPCSLTTETASHRARRLRDKPGWSALSAVRTGRVFALDGSILSRWTPRLAGEL